MNQKLVKIKTRITYKPSVSHKFMAQSYTSSHFLYKHLRTRHDSSWEREQKIKNKDRWNYCRHMPMLPLLGDNHCLTL